MRKTLLLLLSICMLSSCKDGVKDSPLVYADPSEVKIDSAACDKFFRDVYGSGANQVHSLIITKNGKVIYEHYNPGYEPDQLHVLWSATKTFTATAIGFARQDGLLDVNDKVKDFFSPEELPAEQSEWMDELTIHHLLTMSSGLNSFAFGVDTTNPRFDAGHAKAALCSGFSFEPGTMFRYNSYDSYLLSAIVTKVTGKKLADYLNDKLFVPLGIRNYRYLESPEGFNWGGWGLYLSTRSLAKMGQFMLQKGMWEEKQLLDQQWFELAMNEQIWQNAGQGKTLEEEAEIRNSSDWNCGYCYQMWKCRVGDSVRLDGAHGQFSVIFRDKNAVVTTNMYSNKAPKALNNLCEDIYPIL